jgi:hypothetical protein
VVRLISTFAGVALLLAACAGASAPTPPPLDGKQIVTKGMEATANLKSFHAAVALDGDVKVQQLGTSALKLKGTKLDADVDLAGKQAHLTFEAPTLLGLEGEVVATAAATYVKTTLTGPKWQKQANDSGPLPSEVQDPTKAVDDLKAFLEKDGVEVKKLDDLACGTSTCYHVEVTVPSKLLNDATASAGTSASDVLNQDLVLDMQFDRTKLYLTSVSTSMTSDHVGTLQATVTLSAFDEPVTVSVPPDSEVDTSGGGFTLP